MNETEREGQKISTIILGDLVRVFGDRKFLSTLRVLRNCTYSSHICDELYHEFN